MHSNILYSSLLKAIFERTKAFKDFSTSSHPVAVFFVVVVVVVFLFVFFLIGKPPFDYQRPFAISRQYLAPSFIVKIRSFYD